MIEHEIRVAILSQQGQIGAKIVDEYLRSNFKVYRARSIDQIWKRPFDQTGSDDITFVHDAVAVCFGKII
jgi:hypothetical protein